MDDIATLVARIDALEARVAHQDHTIEELNEAITGHWGRIEGLKRQIERVGDQLQEVSGRIPEGPEPPPPHY